MRLYSLLPFSAAVVAASAALAPLAEAQGRAFYPDSDPTAGPAAIHPFGGTNALDPATGNQALLFKVPKALLPAQKTRIVELGFASAETRSHAFGSLTITLGQSTNAVLDQTFSLNMTGFQATGINQASWQWSTPGNQWRTVGMTGSFPFDPQNGDLVILITVAEGASTGAGLPGFRSAPNVPSVLQTAWRFQPSRGTVGTGAPKVMVCWDLADLQTFGGGCAGSNAKVPQLDLLGSASLGKTVQIGLRDASASALGAVLVLDDRLRATPLELAPFGAPGCAVNTFLSYMFPMPISGGGTVVPVAVPLVPAYVGVGLWAQWLAVDTGANALGVSVSSFGRILLGS